MNKLLFLFVDYYGEPEEQKEAANEAALEAAREYSGRKEKHYSWGSWVGYKVTWHSE